MPAVTKWQGRLSKDNGGDKAKLKSEEGLKEIAETLVEGEQLTELNELKA